MASPPSATLSQLLARLEREDPDVVAAIADVDPALLAWCAAQSSRQRLIACTNATRALGRLRRAASTAG